MLRLSDEELKETLTRAREITLQSQELASPEAEYEHYLQAAEEVGIAREAVLQALRERLLIPGESFVEGAQVFARSVDGCWYPATVVKVEGPSATVRFANGSEHACAPEELRPMSLVPGRKIQADLKDWGWWDAVVERYEPEKERVHIVHDDWTGEKEVVKLHRIRLSDRQATPPSKVEQQKEALWQLRLMRWTLAAGTAGTVLGILLQHLFHFLR
jgi:hypothetical protein